MSQQFYSTTDVAEMLGISYDSAIRIMNSLPTVNVGSGKKRSLKRVRSEILDGWLAQQDGYSPISTPLRAIKGGADKPNATIPGHPHGR